ncbi:MAG: COQ9 family protein [Alphaproteobacteria bacterium]|nr:MAG: COQ9 family protein [Alphaproteobacteria bacterium]
MISDATLADDEPLRARLLAAVLAEAAFEGLSARSLTLACKAEGLDPVEAEIAFPGGIRDLIDYWNGRCDQAVLDAMAGPDIAAMKVRERIAFGVRTRLMAAAEHREAVRRALGLLALPQNALTGTRLLYRTVDAIWWAAGDRSTDWNFYSKRGLLAAVYSSTLLFWLDDRSDGFSESWAFLDRRIAEVMKVPGQVAKLKTVAAKLGGLVPPSVKARFAQG